MVAGSKALFYDRAIFKKDLKQFWAYKQGRIASIKGTTCEGGKNLQGGRGWGGR